jgi:hypothetical protein
MGDRTVIPFALVVARRRIGQPVHDGKLEFVVTNVDNARRYQGGQVLRHN